jgi:hypothetical protein
MEIAGQVRACYDLRGINAIADTGQHVTWRGQQSLAAHGGQWGNLNLKWIVHYDDQ